mgnify:CR=1
PISASDYTRGQGARIAGWPAPIGRCNQVIIGRNINWTHRHGQIIACAERSATVIPKAKAHSDKKGEGVVMAA